VGTGGSVLILAATYGEGHIRAAQALAAAIARLEPERPVHVVDFFERVSPVMNRIARRAYVGSVRRVPYLYGRWYDATRAIPEDSLVQRTLDHYRVGGLRRLLEETAPAAVVSTFPIPAGVLSTLRVEEGYDVPSAVAVTDYTVHSQWIHSGIDLYLVGHEELRQGMIARGIDPGRVVTTGIPIDPRFGDVRPDRPDGPPWQILVMGGAYGMLPSTIKLVESLIGIDGVRVVLVAGRDERLRQQGEELAQGRRERLVVTGYTTEIPALMAASHLLVTKAGGLTVSEALAMRLPLMIYRPLPGQEQANVEFLVRHKAARVFHDPASLVHEVGHILARGEGRLAAGQDSAGALGRPTSAIDGARLVLALAEGRHARSGVAATLVPAAAGTLAAANGARPDGGRGR
jgi:processive 1,2-diacylglycerol beta-glucosyltransferase